MDAAILVVAANEGIKPQTREHLIALKAKKINKIIRRKKRFVFLRYLKD